MKDFLFKLQLQKYRNLSDVLALLALGIPFAVYILLELFGVRTGLLFNLLAHLAFMVMFFFAGCIGLLTFLQKEYRQIVVIRGRPAQIFGLILLITSLLLLVYLIIHLIIVLL